MACGAFWAIFRWLCVHVCMWDCQCHFLADGWLIMTEITEGKLSGVSSVKLLKYCMSPWHFQVSFTGSLSYSGMHWDTLWLSDSAWSGPLFALPEMEVWEGLGTISNAVTRVSIQLFKKEGEKMQGGASVCVWVRVCVQGGWWGWGFSLALLLRPHPCDLSWCRREAGDFASARVCPTVPCPNLITRE